MKTDPDAAARAAIDATVAYFASLGMPTCYTELGIGVQSEETLRELADRSMFYGKRKIGGFKELDGEDAYQIYKLANR
jgi:alcohol dehydrogenase YqhD (iron-dependent ADH family)